MIDGKDPALRLRPSAKQAELAPIDVTSWAGRTVKLGFFGKLVHKVKRLTGTTDSTQPRQVAPQTPVKQSVVLAPARRTARERLLATVVRRATSQRDEPTAAELDCTVGYLPPVPEETDHQVLLAARPPLSERIALWVEQRLGPDRAHLQDLIVRTQANCVVMAEEDGFDLNELTDEDLAFAANEAMDQRRIEVVERVHRGPHSLHSALVRRIAKVVEHDYNGCDEQMESTIEEAARTCQFICRSRACTGDELDAATVSQAIADAVRASVRAQVRHQARDSREPEAAMTARPT